jgi:surfeit locus 1 family protein
VKGQGSIWPVVSAATIGIALLSSLGIWQLQRLAQKQALLSEIDRRGAADPVDVSEAIRLYRGGENIEFIKVFARGRFLHDSEKHMIGAFEGNPAWEVVTPLVTADNSLIVVDRGVVPDALRHPDTRTDSNPLGDVEVSGVIRSHGEGRGLFSPANDIKANLWFWWDVSAMLESTSNPQAATPVPLVLQVTPVVGEARFPRPIALRTAIPNNHLQYAITWFALALVLAVIAGLFIVGQMKKSGA